MIHDMIQLVVAVFEVLGSWLRHEIGTADYRIVRIVFFSTLAAWLALDLAKTVARFIHLIRRLMIYYIPPCPEISVMLGLITQDDYDRKAYRIFRLVGRALGTVFAPIEDKIRRGHVWNTNEGLLVRGGKNAYNRKCD